MNYLDASIRGIKFQKQKIKNKIRCKHRGIKPLEINDTDEISQNNYNIIL
jgi:hypothetical protein